MLDILRGCLFIGLALLVVAWVWLNHLWSKQDIEAERKQIREELARRLSLRN